jgi:hypothetical protein
MAVLTLPQRTLLIRSLRQGLVVIHWILPYLQSLELWISSLESYGPGIVTGAAKLTSGQRQVIKKPSQPHIYSSTNIY